MMSTEILAVTAVLCAAVGFILGALIAILFSRRENKVQGDDPRKEGPGAGYRELARLWRDPATGKLITEIDERLLGSAQSLNMEKRRQLQQAAAEWVQWLGWPASQTSQMTAASLPSQQSAPPALTSSINAGASLFPHPR